VPRRRSSRALDESESKSARTRERILDAAAVVLNRNGYAGTRLSDIAGLAGLATPAIYYYFPSRDEVIQEVVQVGLRRTMAHVRASLDEAAPDAGPMERILTAVQAHLEVVLRDSEYSSAAIRNAAQLPPAIREVQLVDQRRYGALWRSLIDAAAASGEINPELDPRAARMPGHRGVELGARVVARGPGPADRGDPHGTVAGASGAGSALLSPLRRPAPPPGRPVRAG
jgi:AcrR family transcriptional regulator